VHQTLSFLRGFPNSLPREGHVAAAQRGSRGSLTAYSLSILWDATDSDPDTNRSVTPMRKTPSG